MRGKERRRAIAELLASESEPLSGGELSRRFGVSRQIVVQDVALLKEQGYENDINEQRLHHEIYMSDARKVAPEKWKTVIRHPIKKV